MNSGRDCLNINDELNVFNVSDVVVVTDERINAQSTIALYKRLQKCKPKGGIYVMCDNALLLQLSGAEGYIRQYRTELDSLLTLNVYVARHFANRLRLGIGLRHHCPDFPNRIIRRPYNICLDCPPTVTRNLADRFDAHPTLP